MPLKIIAGDAKSQDLNDNFGYLESGKASREELEQTNDLISNIDSGPKGIYSTLVALQAAYPSGTEGIYVVSADGHWYYWSGTAWTDGGTYQATEISDASVTEEKTSFLKLGANRFDKEKTTDGYRLTTSGVLFADPAEFVTDYIGVESGVTYKNFYATSNRVCLYDTNKTFVSLLADSLSSGGASFVPSVSGFVRTSYTLASKDTVMICKESEYEGIYEPFGYQIDKILLQDKNMELVTLASKNLGINIVGPENTNFFKPGKNIFNKETVQLDKFMNSGGGISTLANYFTSDFMWVESGKSYTINNCRVHELYDSKKNYLSGLNTGNNTANVTVNPAKNGWLRFSTTTSLIDSSQVEEGTVETSYEAYYLQIADLSLTEEQKNSVLVVEDQYPVKVTKSGNYYTLESKFDSARDITIETTKTGSANGSFNFTRTLVDGVEIHTNSDDITPIRTFSTVGANHGYPLVGITLVGHGKTSADLGSKWTDGATVYTLLKIDGNLLLFGVPYSVDGNGISSYVKVNPTATLTHVSGATNTSSISITGLSEQQLYPSVKEITVKYILDGDEIISDGVFFGKELIVTEEYTVMDYKALIDYAQANIGSNYATGNVDGVVKIANTFTFTKGLKCQTSHSFKPLKAVSILNCGFLQSVTLNGLAGYTRKRFMPGVLPKSGFDFEAGIDLDAYATSINFYPSDYKDPNIPPSHYIDWLYDGSGNKDYGYSMGYVTDKTNSKNADRLANTNQAWDMRSTKKSYPIAMNNSVLDVGDYFFFEGFRNYISGEDAESAYDATNANIVKDKKDVYVYVAFHESGNGLNINLDEHIGKTVSVVQSENFTLLNDVVDASGITFNITLGYGYAVLKLS